mmetsp:Transcript_4838/g.11292  ORF Transcript_4838/g.11292 Transcript_4838/m.11292 type:complete len:223 (+) Transcript_4838:1045-1713(+)
MCPSLSASTSEDRQKTCASSKPRLSFDIADRNSAFVNMGLPPAKPLKAVTRLVCFCSTNDLAIAAVISDKVDSVKRNEKFDLRRLRVRAVRALGAMGEEEYSAVRRFSNRITPSPVSASSTSDKMSSWLTPRFSIFSRFIRPAAVSEPPAACCSTLNPSSNDVAPAVNDSAIAARACLHPTIILDFGGGDRMSSWGAERESALASVDSVKSLRESKSWATVS